MLIISQFYFHTIIKSNRIWILLDSHAIYNICQNQKILFLKVLYFIWKYLFVRNSYSFSYNKWDIWWKMSWKKDTLIERASSIDRFTLNLNSDKWHLQWFWWGTMSIVLVLMRDNVNRSGFDEGQCQSFWFWWGTMSIVLFHVPLLERPLYPIWSNSQQ